MLLKRIELQGFKSFANKSIIIFNSGVTGIISPNGCGKSDTSDVIRQVLGEQSVKSLHESDMSNVVFGGSTARKAVNMAEVALVFGNSRHTMNVEFEEVEVTHRLHRMNGEGEYFTNKAPCRLKDIVNLVMDTGLDRNSLSIISQGNISALVDAKPEGRRALSEEATGAAKCKKHKNKSLSKLNRIQDNLSRLEDIIMELKRQVNPLKRRAKKAGVYLERRKRLEVIEVSVLVDEIEKLSEQIDILKKKTFDLDSQKVMHETAIQIKDVKNGELRNEICQLGREMDELQEQCAKLSEESRMLETRKIEIDEKRKYALEFVSDAEKAKELKAMMEEARYEYEDRSRRLRNLEADITLQKETVIGLEHDVSYCAQENAQTISILSRLENRGAVLENLVKQPFSHQQAVKSVLDTGPNGILGVVSQLFKPLTSYETTISNALGGVLYHIVTVDREATRHAITFLKKNQSRHATFLPLLIMKPHYMQKEHRMLMEDSVGFLGVANEFVENDAQFDTLRDALFGNVVITDDLIHVNTITKLLRFQYKIVTLEGDVVNREGSMTSGKGRNNSTPLTIQKELNQVLQNLEG